MKQPLAVFHPGYLGTLLSDQTISRLVAQFEEIVYQQHGPQRDNSLFYLEFRVIHFEWKTIPHPFRLPNWEKAVMVVSANWQGRHLRLIQVGFYEQYSREPQQVQQLMNTYQSLIVLDCLDQTAASKSE